MPSPSAAGNTRKVYVPACVGRMCRVSWRPYVQSSPPAGQVLDAITNPDGPESSASRSGSHAYWKQPRGGRSIRHCSEPPVVTVAAIGAPRSSAPRVNVFDQLPLFATDPVKYWCAGNGVDPEDPSASATAP